MKVVVIKGFPFSGSDLLKQLLLLTTDARFVSLSEIESAHNCFIETNADIRKRGFSIFCVCLIHHPEIVFRHWLAYHKFPVGKKTSFNFNLEFNKGAGKSWFDYYSQAKKKNNMLIHYYDLIKRPKSIVRLLSQVIPFLGYDARYCERINVRSLRQREWVEPTTELPRWLREEIRERYCRLYESLGFSWREHNASGKYR